MLFGIISRLVCSSIIVCLSFTTVLNPPTNISITVDGQNITSFWDGPEGNSDVVTMYCEGLEEALSKSVTVNSNEQTATCTELTPGAIYDVILAASLNASGLAPAENSTDVKTDVTGKTDY